MKVKYKNKEYTLTKEAYIDDFGSKVVYRADAIDENGNDFFVLWELLNENEDESERCDWEHPWAIYSYDNFEPVR